MKTLLYVVVASLFISAWVLPAYCSKKPVGKARREDIPYIKCQVCEKLAKQLYHQVQKKQAEIAPKKVCVFLWISSKSLRYVLLSTRKVVFTSFLENNWLIRVIDFRVPDHWDSRECLQSQEGGSWLDIADRYRRKRRQIGGKKIDELLSFVDVLQYYIRSSGFRASFYFSCLSLLHWLGINTWQLFYPTYFLNSWWNKTLKDNVILNARQLSRLVRRYGTVSQLILDAFVCCP